MAKIKFHVCDNGLTISVSYDENITVEEFMRDYVKKNTNFETLDTTVYVFKVGFKILNSPRFMHRQLKEMIQNDMTITFIRKKDLHYSGGYFLEKELNIKFIKSPKSSSYINCNSEIKGLLKLCLLKEVSQKIELEKLKTLSEIIYYIMRILQNGKIIDDGNIKQNIQDVLEKMRGSNLINFSNYVDEVIDSYDINKILNFLSKSDLNEMNDIKSRLSKYNECITLFNKEFEKSKKESIFEFSVISLVVIERENFEKYEQERNK